jgi:uncharacterized membrane protein
MLRDERIIRARNRIASRGYALWAIGFMIALLYRQFYLRQPPREYWDIALVFFSGNLYVTIASFAQGAFHESAYRKSGKWTIAGILLAVLAVMVVQGQIGSLLDVVAQVASVLAGLSVFGLLSYYLYRRWEKQT